MQYFVFKRMRTQEQRGFTLLLASLVVAIILAVGASIFAIAQKELILSSIGRDSQFAFYAADTAAECALYWDVRYDYFDPVPPGGVTPTCGGELLNATGHPGTETYPYTVEFEIGLFANVDGVTGTPDDLGNCVRVSVTKDIDPISTYVRADGFSTDCASVKTNPRTLQRSVELNY